MDPYGHMVGSPFAADQPLPGVEEGPCCDWCSAVVNLDGEGMLVAHTGEDGAHCPGSHGDDWHVHFKSNTV